MHASYRLTGELQRIARNCAAADYRLLYPVTVAVAAKWISVQRQLLKRRQRPREVSDRRQPVAMKQNVDDAGGTRPRTDRALADVLERRVIVQSEGGQPGDVEEGFGVDEAQTRGAADADATGGESGQATRRQRRQRVRVERQRVEVLEDLQRLGRHVVQAVCGQIQTPEVRQPGEGSRRQATDQIARQIEIAEAAETRQRVVTDLLYPVPTEIEMAELRK